MRHAAGQLSHGAHFLRLALLLFGQLLLGDVLDGAGFAVGRPGDPLDRLAVLMYPADLAVSGHQPVFDLELLAAVGLHNIQAPDAMLIVGMDETRDKLPVGELRHFTVGHAHDLCHFRRYGHQGPFDIEGPGAKPRQGVRLPIQGLALAQSLFHALAFADLCGQCVVGFTQLGSSCLDPALQVRLSLQQGIFGFLPGNVGAGPTVAAEFSLCIEHRLTVDRQEDPASVGKLSGMAEVAKGAMRGQIGQVPLPVRMLDIGNAGFLPRLAQQRLLFYPGDVGEVVREIGKAEIRVHFPEPVRGCGSEVLETAFAGIQLRLCGGGLPPGPVAIADRQEQPDRQRKGAQSQHAAELQVNVQDMGRGPGAAGGMN